MKVLAAAVRTAAVIALVLVAGRSGDASEEPLGLDCLVALDTGPVRGYIRRAEYDAAYLSFRGIPYAEQPLGELRFKPPQPARPWSEVWDAQDEGPVCPQHDYIYGKLMAPRGMHEACLHINVHVPIGGLPRPPPRLATPLGAYINAGARAPPPPAPPTQPLLPVLVFIHGGGFGLGSGDADLHGPEYLVTKGVLVVTFNYRLNALGFLSLDSPELPGNLGMRDMVEALRWVRRNIAAFGGDPDNVTLGGQSAGAFAAHLLTLSPMARGLFHRVILMSGVATRSFFSTSPANAQRLTGIFLQKLNITLGDPSETLRALQSVDVDRIVAAVSEMQDSEGLATFGPVVESKFEGVEAFLDEDPYAVMSEGRSLDVPLIIGHTDKECHIFVRRFREIDFLKRAQAQPAVLTPPSLLFTSTPPQLEERVQKIMKRYFPDGVNEDSFENFIDYCSDSYFVYPALKVAEVVSRRTRSPVFVYEYAYNGTYSPVKEEVGGGFVGAGHVEDMTYVLRTNSYAGDIAPGSQDEWVKDWMTAMFTNYMKTSDPTPEFPGGQSLEWPPFSAESELSLSINDTILVQRHAHLDLLSFFDDLYGDADTTEDLWLQTENYPAADRAEPVDEHASEQSERGGSAGQDDHGGNEAALPSTDLLTPETDK